MAEWKVGCVQHSVASQEGNQDSDAGLSDSNLEVDAFTASTLRSGWALFLREWLRQSGADGSVGELARNLLAPYFSLLVPNWLFHCL